MYIYNEFDLLVVVALSIILGSFISAFAILNHKRFLYIIIFLIVALSLLITGANHG